MKKRASDRKERERGQEKKRVKRNAIEEIQQKNNIFTDYVKSTYMNTMCDFFFFCCKLFVVIALLSCLVCGLSIGRISWTNARVEQHTNKNQIDNGKILVRERECPFFSIHKKQKSYVSH